MSELVALKEHASMFDLYDSEGYVVGIANPGKKVMLADSFYVPERTCRPVHTREKWECGACGCEIMPGFMPVFKGVGVLRYCPNCGAKVVDE